MGSFRVAALAFLVLLLGASLAPAQRVASIEGQVRSETGQLIPTVVRVRLETYEGVVISDQKANTEGQFRIYNLRKTIYWLNVEAEGFRPYRRQFEMLLAGDNFHADIQLLPMGNRETSSGAAPSRTDQVAPKDARKLYEKAQKALSRHQASRAKTFLEKAVAQYPCYARARTDLALVYFESEDYPATESMLRKAVECDPDFVPSYGLLAMLFNRQNRYAESEKVLQEGLRRAPSDGYLHELLGTAFYMEGRDALAESELLRALSFHSKDPGECHARLAAVYLRSKDYQRAYEQMRAYLQIEPDGRFAVRLRKIMGQLVADGQVRSENPQYITPADPKP
jgi:tetratricopeptide (TPR) repeat protein